MTDSQIVTAIIASIQTDANVILVIRALITNNLPNVTDAQLQAIAAILGIQTS